MMQAVNTGHEGSLSTVHANSPRDALARIENMILMAGLDLPVRVIREQMGSALHVTLQLARFADGRRRVVALTEITGMEGDVVVTQDLFRFVQAGTDARGRLEPTGIMPTFADIMAQAGYRVDWGKPLAGNWGEP